MMMIIIKGLRGARSADEAELHRLGRPAVEPEDAPGDDQGILYYAIWYRIILLYCIVWCHVMQYVVITITL